MSLALTACGDDGGGATTETTGDATSPATDSTGIPTGTDAVSVGSTDETPTGSISGTGTATDSSSSTSEPTTATTGDTIDVDPSTGTTSPVDPMTTTDGTSTGGDTSTSTGDEAGESSSSTGDPVECTPSENIESSCDLIDNDCDGEVDNVDAGGDGICDCLNIGILGASGFAPSSNFEAWLEDQGSAVTRTLLANKPGVVTPALLAQYDLVLVDRIERALSAEEAAALEAFVKDDGRGVITLIGYNFDNGNPAPERDRANSALAPFGLAYQGGYFGNQVIPMFNQGHPIGEGILDVNFAGGIMPVDIGNQGLTQSFATVQGMNAGLAHQTDMEGGRVVVWGDEWITFDSDWQGYADVQDFWVNIVGWAKPNDFCADPQ